MASTGFAWQRAVTSTLLWGALVAVGIFVVAVLQDQQARDSERVAVAPGGPGGLALSAAAVAGRKVFNARCAFCHGRGARGGSQGPPLVHDAYAASRFGDDAIVAAVRKGVVAKRWQFGNMPVIDAITDGDLSAVIRYIREIQIAHDVH